MPKIFFICDSPSDLRPEYIEGRNIAVISATVTYDGIDHLEYPDVVPEQYWDVLERLPDVPQTAQAKLLDYYEAMKQAQADGFTHIMVMSVSTTAAGSLQNAKLAYEMLQEELGDQAPAIALVDSRGYAMMYGVIVLECEQMARDGADFDAVVAHARRCVAKSEALFMVYSLKQMRKSGRISGMSAFAGEAMGIRPILLACDGSINPIDKVRGDKKLLPRMLELFDERCVAPSEQTVSVLYAKLDEAEIAACERALRDRGVRDVKRYPIGACVTTNTGPYCLAVVYHGKERG